jgi:uncharacterized membrane protein
MKYRSAARPVVARPITKTPGKTDGPAKIPLFKKLGTLMVTVLIAFGPFIVGSLKSPSNMIFVGTAEASVTPVTTGSEVTIPEDAFSDGKARFFKHVTPEGKKVQYFIIKSSDGVIRAAFDACDVCWESGKGYKQEGDLMICRNCGRRFPSAKINVVAGGCNPSALTRTMRDGKVVIPVQALNDGKRLFK